MSKPVDSDQLDISDELIAERRGNLTLPDDMSSWMASIIGPIDKLSYWSGLLVCWLLIPIMFSMGYEVVLRHFFNMPTLWAYDISRMFAGAFFMLGAAYGLLRGVHVRADFIYRNWQVKTQAKVDGILYVLFYFPGFLFFFIASLDFAMDSWIRGQLGMDTAWMPMMSPIKSAIPVGTFLLLLQGISEFLKCLYAVKHNKWP